MKRFLSCVVLVVATGCWHSEGEYLSGGKGYSIQKVLDPAGSGEECFRFEVRKGDEWVNGGGGSSRAEIETRERPAMGAVMWYRFGLMLPSDFPIEDNRLVLAQWHGVDKKYLGEPGRSPVMAVRYRNGKMTITLRHSAERIVHDPDAVPAEQLFATRDFRLGEWNDFVVQAKWDFTEAGFVNVWWNGKQVVQYRGPVGYNDDVGPYFQYGIYRDETEATYVSFMRHVKMGSEEQEGTR